MNSNVSESQVNAVFALGTLVEGAKEINRILYSEDDSKWDRYECYMEVPRHPFGLGFPANRTHYRRWEGAAWCGYPGYTEPSVKTFTAYVLDRFTHAAADSVVGYMRQIFLESNSKQRENHWVCFDIMIGGDVFMCGGCTDCSGAGQQGKAELERLFEVISKVTGVPVDKVTIPYERARPMWEALNREFDRWHSS